MPITQRALHLQAALEQQLNKMVNQQTRDLVQAWIRAWDETAGDLTGALQQILTDSQTGVVAKTLMVRNSRLTEALQHIGQQLTSLANTAGVRITGDLRGVVEDAAKAQAPILQAQFPHAAPALRSTVNAATIDAIVRRSATQITARTYPLAPDAYDAVQRELLRGVIVGTNPKDTAARIVDRAEMRFNGGLARALTISRTETLDAHRNGAQHGQEAHADVMAGWVWLAHLDPKTCPACVGMNGTIHGLDEPGPLGHQNCRCSRMPKTKTWAELGFPELAGDEPSDAVQDSEEWFDGLTEAEQRKLLGRERFEAWRRGEYPVDQWARRKQNPGWRDSYVPAKPGEGNGGEVFPRLGDDNGPADDAAPEAPAAAGQGGGQRPPSVPPTGGEPPEPPRPPSGPDEVAAMLDEAYRPWLDGLADEQRAAIESWQRDDRHYDDLQEPFRADIPVAPEVQDEIDHLVDAVEGGTLPADVDVWKGVRSIRKVFEVAPSELASRIGSTIPYAGFFATSLSRDVAVKEFTTPPGAPMAALLRLTLPAGISAAWIAGAGQRRLRYQYELLARGISLRILDVTYPDGADGLAVVSVEVVER